MTDQSKDDRILQKMREREFWVVSHVAVTLQALKDQGIVKGGYTVSPELQPLVRQAQELYEHSDPTDQEVYGALAALQSRSDDL